MLLLALTIIALQGASACSSTKNWTEQEVKKYSAPEEHVLDGLTAPLETSHILTIPKLGRIWNMSFSFMPSSAPRDKHVILGLFQRKTCGAPVESSDAILELEFKGFNNGDGELRVATIY